MALRRPNLFRLAAAAAAFLVTLLVLTLVNGPEPSPGEARRDKAASGSLLGETYIQRARETGDAAFLERADAAFRRALQRDPRDAGAVAGLGALAATRHDFGSALRHGRRARALAPEVVRPYGVVVDALVELGRYGQAERMLQRMIDLKPDLASYARVSYLRELQGDLDGALEAMRLAVSAGGEAPEQVAYVQTLLGDLELDRTNAREARDAYRLALARLPGYVDARFGLARAAVQEGDLRGALGQLRGVVAERPDADHVLLLGEVELRLGRSEAGRRHIDRALRTEAQALAAGSKPDAGAVLLEADHGDRSKALGLARQVWRGAPSVTSADALGWALTRNGRPRQGLRYGREALKLGTRRASFHYHAGIAALGAGQPKAARRYLRTAVRLNPAFSPLDSSRARRALRQLQP